MTIVYALVARQRAVLAEATTSSGNFPTVTRVLLGKIDSTSDCRMSYVYDEHVFHYIVDNGITFLCMATEDQKRRVTFDFLEDVKQTWRASYTAVESTALAFSLNDEFKSELQSKMNYYSNEPDSDQIAKVNQRISDVKDVMVENIDKVLENREKIELLVDKTDGLTVQAFKFEKQSRNLKNDLWCRGVRNKIIMGIVIVMILAFTMMMICGYTFSRCGAPPSSSSSEDSGTSTNSTRRSF